jgi:AraC-like DNA-binding protein
MLVDRHPLPGPTHRSLEHREHIDWHDHAEHQLVYPSSGVLHVRTDRGSWVVPPRRAVWLPAGIPHSHRAYGRTHMLTLAFPVGVNPLGVAEPAVLAVSGLLREAIIALATGARLDPDDRADLYRVVLRRLTPAPAPARFHLPAPADQRLRGIADLLAGDPANTSTLAEFGRAVGASERTLSRLFRRDTGMSFPQWRAQLRLQHAMLLLAAGSSVTAAAIGSGYSNVSAFIAAFRDAFGVTPATYRDQTPPDAAASPGKLSWGGDQGRDSAVRASRWREYHFGSKCCYCCR